MLQVSQLSALPLAIIPVVLDLECPIQHPNPEPVDIEQIASGGDHTCAVAASGSRLRCWGRNDLGQLGYAHTNDIGDDELPYWTGADVDLGGFGPVAQLAANFNHTCALNLRGHVRCWGYYLVLGTMAKENIGDDEDPYQTAEVNLGYVDKNKKVRRTAQQLAVNALRTCALVTDGSIRCWGENSDGELGLGFSSDPIGDDETPGEVPAVPLGAKALAVAGGGDHFCAITEAKNVRCWGQNNDGQLGYGHEEPIGDDDTPAEAGDVDLGGDEIVQLAVGGAHTCALNSLKQVRCWGFNHYGQLGYGHTADIGDNELPISEKYVAVDKTRSVVQIAAGAVHTCAVLDDGAVKCWGYGVEGQLGHGDEVTIGDNETPSESKDVAIGGQTEQLVMGQHACALLTSKRVRCWGLPWHGQLGHGNTKTIGDDEDPKSAGDVLVY